MKSQISVEFITTILIFISFASFVLLNMYNFKAQSLYSFRIENTWLETYRASEILINDEGYPSNWDSTNVKRIGLAINNESKNYLNITKISYLKVVNPSNNNCENITKLIGLTKVRISLNITKIYPKKEVLFNCTDPFTKTFNVSVERYVYLSDGNLSSIKVYGS